MEEMEKLFIADLNVFINSNLNFNKIKFSMFIVIMVIIYIFVWNSYLKNLNNKIWRTKGMLKMIPLEIITQNENLKNAFLSGDILVAVK